MNKHGIVLVNVGTPDSPTPKDVAKYLRQFLMDPLVIDIPFLLRWFLVKVLIVPKRSFSSAEAYEKIWTKKGSPLKFLTEELTNKIRGLLPTVDVEYAMRYQNPSIEHALSKLAHCEKILVAPLYPQYSLASTESARKEFKKCAQNLGLQNRLLFLEPFYKEEGFLNSFVETIRPFMANSDHVLFSFHGLPERHILKTDPTNAHCLKQKSCCEKLTPASAVRCYRAQSFSTARELADKLKISRQNFTVSFQSRLTKKWIEPYTDEILPQLYKAGVRKLLVACPSFTTDCLETIEEIGIRAKKQWQELGGEELILAPCPNANDTWADALSKMTKKILEN